MEVEGVKVTSLVDSGACMSAMVKSFAGGVRFRILSLFLPYLDIESTGGEGYHIMDM